MYSATTKKRKEMLDRPKRVPNSKVGVSLDYTAVPPCFASSYFEHIE